MSFTWLRHFCDNKTENENLFFRIVDLNKIRLFAIETSKSIHSSTNSYTSITCESHYKSWAFTILTHLCIVSKNLYYTGLFLCIVTFLFNEIVEMHGRYKKSGQNIIEVLCFKLYLACRQLISKALKPSHWSLISLHILYDVRP